MANTTIAPAAPLLAHRSADGSLTRAGMVHIISSGASVIYNGKIYSAVEQLPSEADMAKTSGDKTQLNSVEQETRNKIADLERELAGIKTAQKESAQKAQEDATKTPAAPAAK